MFEFLSEIGRKLYGFIYDAVKSNIDFNDFYNSVKDIYENYGEYEAYMDFVKMKQQLQWWDEMGQIAENEAWGRDYFAPSIRPTPKRYMITFEVEGFNAKTNIFEKRYISIGFDTLMIRREWEREIYNIFKMSQEEGKSDIFAITNIKPVKAWRGW